MNPEPLLQSLLGRYSVGPKHLVEPGPVPAARVVRATARRTLTATHGMTKWFLTEPPFGHVEMYAVRIEPGGSTGPERYHHGDAEEVLLVLTGEVVVELDDERFELASGDTIVYASSTPHRVAISHGQRAGSWMHHAATSVHP